MFSYKYKMLQAHDTHISLPPFIRNVFDPLELKLSQKFLVDIPQ